MSKIPEHLIEKIESIPTKPGIYQMKDIDGNIMYIGKSKTLKSRVKSYFYTEHKWKKIKKMVFHIHDIDFIVTDTHLEAQILECALIKKIKPIYNTQFKNDKKYMYLKIENYNRFKPMAIVREREGENCFGPYKSKNILSDVILFFEKIVPITKSNDSYEFTYKTLPQPMDKETFKKNKESLMEIFSEKKWLSEFLSEIEKNMMEAALGFQFETASIYRDMLGYIKYLFDHNTKGTSHLRTSNVLLGERIEEGYKIFYIANDRILLKKKFTKLTRDTIHDFLRQANEREENGSFIKNEKRDLDFRSIINTEIRDQISKSILFIDTNYDLDEFINKLIKVE